MLKCDLTKKKMLIVNVIIFYLKSSPLQPPMFYISQKEGGKILKPEKRNGCISMQCGFLASIYSWVNYIGLTRLNSAND